MARAYTVSTAALALEVDAKWLDNILTHYRVPGVPRRKQGVARGLSNESILILGIALRLMQSFGIPMSRSIGLALKLVEGFGQYNSPDGPSLSVNFPALVGHINERLAAAVEIAPVPHRGRPPQNKTGRL